MCIRDRFFAGIRDEADRMEHFERLERRTRETYRLGAWVRPRVIEFALRQTEAVSRRANRVFDGVDVLLTPAIAHRPPRVGILDNAGTVESMLRAMPAIAYAAIWNVAGNPAAALPCGLADDGLPTSVQLVGRPCGADGAVGREASGAGDPRTGVCHRSGLSHPASSGHGRAASSCADRLSRVVSSCGRPTSCTEVGTPSSAMPHGTAAAGLPATFQMAA